MKYIYFSSWSRRVYNFWYFCFSISPRMAGRVTQFLKQTSIKGIPRIFRTKSYFLRTLWGVSVVCFLTMAAYQTFLLARGYLAYNSVISMTEYNLDYSGQSSNAVRFPDVTFCNLNPFAVNTHNVSNIHSLEYYHNRVIDRTSCDTCSEQQLKSLEELRVELLTTSGYYIHIGASKAELISHTEEELIVSCKVSMVSGMHQRRVPCEGITTVVPYQDYMYYNCYTVKLPPPTPEDLYCGLVVVLHLNNHLEMIEQQKFLTPHYIPGQMSGALMVLHEPEHLPVVIRDSISLPSGYFMSTILQFRKTNRLPSPHGDCKHGHEVNAHYQQLICYSTCVQTLVLQSCACVDYTSYNDFFALVAKAGIPACLSVKVSAERLHKNWECVKKIRLNSTAHCLSSCPIPCEELVYIHDVRLNICVMLLHIQQVIKCYSSMKLWCLSCKIYYNM